MKTVLVTGSNGLLGQKITDLFSNKPDYKLIATGRGTDRYKGPNTTYSYESLDFSDPSDIERVISKHQPDHIIHGGAMTQVDDCQLNPLLCDQMNVDATRNLARAAEKVGAHFSFVSTDFVFDGEKGMYKETDTPAPLSHYGWSKYEAEKWVQEICSQWSIVRTILVYGVIHDASRSNIILWAKGALEKGDEMRVIDDQYRMPTLAEDLADGCFRIAERSATGIYHISGPDYLNIFEIVKCVGEELNLSLDKVKVIDSNTLNQPAKRPPKTGFDLSKAKDVLGYQPKSLSQGIQMVVKQLGEN